MTATTEDSFSVWLIIRDENNNNIIESQVQVAHNYEPWNDISIKAALNLIEQLRERALLLDVQDLDG